MPPAWDAVGRRVNLDFYHEYAEDIPFSCDIGYARVSEASGVWQDIKLPKRPA